MHSYVQWPFCFGKIASSGLGKTSIFRLEEKAAATVQSARQPYLKTLLAGSISRAGLRCWSLQGASLQVRSAKPFKQNAGTAAPTAYLPHLHLATGIVYAATAQQGHDCLTVLTALLLNFAGTFRRASDASQDRTREPVGLRSTFSCCFRSAIPGTATACPRQGLTLSKMGRGKLTQHCNTAYLCECHRIFQEIRVVENGHPTMGQAPARAA